VRAGVQASDLSARGTTVGTIGERKSLALVSVPGSRTCADKSGASPRASRRPRLGTLLLEYAEMSGSSYCARNLRRNDFLYVIGEPGDAIHLIVSGWVKRVVPSYLGKESLVDIHLSGDIVGEISLADGRRHDSAIAMSSCVVLVIPSEVLYVMLDSVEVRLTWVEYMSDRLRRQQEIIWQFATMDCRTRLTARLAMLGHLLATVDDGQRIQLPRWVTHEDLASIVGTTRSRIGTFLRDLEADGLVIRSRTGLTFDPSQLLACVGGSGAPTRTSRAMSQPGRRHATNFGGHARPGSVGGPR
jgi:CRP/FNR family cyclic AMP-dependent transcriptional regulator